MSSDKSSPDSSFVQHWFNFPKQKATALPVITELREENFKLEGGLLFNFFLFLRPLVNHINLSKTNYLDSRKNLAISLFCETWYRPKNLFTKTLFARVDALHLCRNGHFLPIPFPPSPSSKAFSLLVSISCLHTVCGRARIFHSRFYSVLFLLNGIFMNSLRGVEVTYLTKNMFSFVLNRDVIYLKIVHLVTQEVYV